MVAGELLSGGVAAEARAGVRGGKFNTIEINGSFYSLQRPESYAAWHEQTPAGFVFSVKGGRFITHMKKLREVEAPLANFFASGVLCLKEKLGPILWQFPPNLGFDVDRFEAFFRMLPRTTKEAARLARTHDARLEGRSHTKADADRPIRHAVEVRHASFAGPEFIDLLRLHGIAFVFADTAGRWPYGEDLTADFVYCRLHGAEELYVSGYTDGELDHWASRIRRWQCGEEPSDAKRSTPAALPCAERDAYVYFDNDAKVKAPFDAMNLAQRLGLSPGDAQSARRRRGLGRKPGRAGRQPHVAGAGHKADGAVRTGRFCGVGAMGDMGKPSCLSLRIGYFACWRLGLVNSVVPSQHDVSRFQSSPNRWTVGHEPLRLCG